MVAREKDEAGMVSVICGGGRGRMYIVASSLLLTLPALRLLV